MVRSKCTTIAIIISNNNHNIYLYIQVYMVKIKHLNNMQHSHPTKDGIIHFKNSFTHKKYNLIKFIKSIKFRKKL